MKTQRHAAYLLLLLSILMLGVPVIPHHHHADGVLCMRNDVQSGCCTPSPDEAEGHCCCDTGCLFHLSDHPSRTTSVYAESLHDTLLTRVTGLRAPPALYG